MGSKRRRAVIRTLLQKQGSGCCYCGVPMTMTDRTFPREHAQRDSVTLEHLDRLADGGSNRIDNLALACLDCNEGRGSMDWFTYKSYRMGELCYGIPNKENVS